MDEYKTDFGFRCGKCNTQYRHKKTSQLCCTKMGCGKEFNNNGIWHSVCGKTITNGYFELCKECKKTHKHR